MLTLSSGAHPSTTKVRLLNARDVSPTPKRPVCSLQALPVPVAGFGTAQRCLPTVPGVQRMCNPYRTELSRRNSMPSAKQGNANPTKPKNDHGTAQSQQQRNQQKLASGRSASAVIERHKRRCRRACSNARLRFFNCRACTPEPLVATITERPFWQRGPAPSSDVLGSSAAPSVRPF